MRLFFHSESISMKGRFCIVSALTLLLTGIAATAAQAEDRVIRIGIIGLDTSHVTAFTATFQKAKPGSDLAGFKVVAAFPGGSPDIESSRIRVEGFTNKLKESGVEIVASIEELLPKVDALLLESVDGRPHLKQAKVVFDANEKAATKKPLFIDKPLAGSLADAVEVFRLAEKSGTPCFSSSSLRYDPAIVAVHDGKFGNILGCVAHSPCTLEEHHPDLFWYGIHGVEILYTTMGPGCVSVSCIATKETHVVTGVWSDGRVGTFRGLRNGKQDYGVQVYGTKANGSCEPVKVSYEPLLVEIAKFFRTGKSPVIASETLELFAFMQAADVSQQLGGKSVSVTDLLQKALMEKSKSEK